MDADSITPLSPGVAAPDFTLTDVLSGQPVTRSAFNGQGTILDFWSVDCPWSRYYDDFLIERQTVWQEQGVALLLINSNQNETPEQMHDMADAYGIRGPILLDPSCRVADAYGAQTTPHIFIVNGSGLIVYQGAIDDRSFRQQQPLVNYLDQALAALAAGRPLSPALTPAYGCTIVRHT